MSVGDRSFLRHDFRIQCYTTKHETMVPLAIGFLVLFSFLFPLLVLLQLCRHRKRLHTPEIRHRFGFLYRSFNIGGEYWEIHEVFRKMILTGLLVFIPDNSRPAVAILVSVLSVASLNYVKPHRNILVFWVAQGSFLVTTFKYLSVILLTNVKVGSDENQISDVIGTLLVVLDATFMIVSCLSMVAVLLVLSSIISKTKKSSKTISSETETARDIQIRSSVVVPINHTEGSGTAHIYAALKLQQNVRNALHKKLAAKVSDDEKSVNAIQRKSSNHRNRAVAQIKRRHTARSTSIHAKVDARNKAKRSKALQMCSIFSELHDVSICKIIDQMHYDVVPNNTVICKQGEVADIFYLLMAGTAKVEIDGEIVNTMKELDVFGESALFPNANGKSLRGATVTANSMHGVQMLCLSKENFDILVRSKTLNEDCMLKLKAIAMTRITNVLKTLKEDKSSVEVAVSVDKGGTKVTEPPVNVRNQKGSLEVVLPSNSTKEHVEVEEIRILLSQVIKSPDLLRKIFVKFNHHGGNVNELSRKNFEKLLEKTIERAKKKQKKDWKYLKDETWAVAVGNDNNNGNEKKTIEFARFVTWLGFSNGVATI